MKCGYNIACFVEVGICFVILLFTVYLQSTRLDSWQLFLCHSSIGCHNKQSQKGVHADMFICNTGRQKFFTRIQRVEIRVT